MYYLRWYLWDRITRYRQPIGARPYTSLCVSGVGRPSGNVGADETRLPNIVGNNGIFKDNQLNMLKIFVFY